MKKFTAVILAVMMFAVLAVTASAVATMADDFSGDLSNWDAAGSVAIADGKMVLGGNPGNWVESGYEVKPNFEAEKYIATFEIHGDQRDCYYGFGFRCPADAFGDLQNGGRNDIPQPTEMGHGISVDIFSKGTDCAGKFVVSFNDGVQSESANFKVAYPEGYTPGAAATFKLVDNGSDFELYVNDGLLCKVTLAGLTEGYYTEASAKAADGSDLGSFTVSVLQSGKINFYQRNNTVWVDNFKADEIAPAEAGDVAVVVIATVAIVALAGAVVCKKVNA